MQTWKLVAETTTDRDLGRFVISMRARMRRARDQRSGIRSFSGVHARRRTRVYSKEGRIGYAVHV